MKEQYAWRHYYWILTDEGTAYLRQYLNLPDEIEPITRERARAQRAPAMPRSTDVRAGYGKMDEGRGAYRTADKAADVGIGAATPAFAGAGFGRGRPM